jgi:DNA-binding NarL/FixJ family response regulator
MPIDGDRVGLNNRTIRVFIADGSLLFRSGLRVLLSSEPDMTVVGEAAELTETVHETRLSKPDLLVLDVGLVAGARHAALREIGCAVLLLAAEQDNEHLQLAIEAGARAYMLKGSNPAELVAGIRQLALEGEDDLTGLSRIAPDLHALRLSTAPGQRMSELTAREQEVIRMLAEGRTARQTAAELGLSVKTVEAHKLNLMRKLDVHDRASLIASAVESGLVPGAMER